MKTTTRTTAGISALALAAGVAALALTTPTTAVASDPRPCLASYTVTKTGSGQPLAEAEFAIAAPNGSVIVPADSYMTIFSEYVTTQPGTDAFQARIKPTVDAINELTDAPVAAQMNWSRWYTATDPATQSQFMETWRTMSEPGDYRSILEGRVAKADAIPDGVGAEAKADAEAALTQLAVTLDPTTTYGDWATAHKSVYSTVSTRPTVAYSPNMTAAEQAQDADAKAQIVSRYSSTATRTSGADGQFTFAVWKPGVNLGASCDATAISPVLTETKAPTGFELLGAPVSLSPRTTTDDSMMGNSATVENKPVKPTPTPEPSTPTPTPEPSTPTPTTPVVTPTPEPSTSTPTTPVVGLPDTGV